MNKTETQKNRTEMDAEELIAILHVKKANDYINKGEFQKAIDELDIVLNSNFSDPYWLKVVYMGLQAAYAYFKKWDKVIYFCYKEEEIGPGDEFYLRLGNAYCESKQFEKARCEYLKNLSINPLSHETRYQLGNNYKYESNYKEAIIEYKTAIALKPDYAEIYISLAGAYLLGGDLKNAKRILVVAKNLFLGLNEIEEMINMIDNNPNQLKESISQFDWTHLDLT